MGKDYSQYEASHPFAYVVSTWDKRKSNGWFKELWHLLKKLIGWAEDNKYEDIIKHLVCTKEWKELENELNEKLVKHENNDRLIKSTFDEYEEKFSKFIIKSNPSFSLVYKKLEKDFEKEKENHDLTKIKLKDETKILAIELKNI